MSAILELAKIVNPPEIGKIEGVCRFTGQQARGLPFEKWVKDTFTNFDCLLPGTIISNEALFCFDEASEIIREKTGRDKPQRFRTYSHVLTTDGQWLVFTKANKKDIADLILSGKIHVLCLTDSGQKHVFFKHKLGFWQLDDMFVKPDISDFSHLHGTMMELLALGFGQEQIKTGNYYHAQILKVGIDTWQSLENQLKARRGEPIFDLAAWLMYTVKPTE